MRILFVNDRCGYFGGVEQNIALTATALAARGHTCTLACADPGGDAEARFRACFTEVLACGELEGAVPGTGASLAALVARLDADVVYLHKVARLPDLDALPGRVPRLRMVHDHDLCCPRSHKYFAVTGRVCTQPAGWRCYLDGAFLARGGSSRLGLRVRSLSSAFRELARHHALDRLLVGSVFMRDELLLNGFAPDRVRIIAPAVADAAAPVLLIRAARTVLYVGQLVRGKGVDLLLEAFAKLRRREQPSRDRPVATTRLMIVGQGNHEPALRALAARLGIAADVEFSGWVPNEQLGALYGAAGVVAFPSRWPEPFGMVGLEAMRHGRPVVGFDVGGVRDWLSDGETGVLVPEQDVEAFARGMSRVLDNPVLGARMGAAARLRASQLFSFGTYLDMLEALFDECGRDRSLPPSVSA